MLFPWKNNWTGFSSRPQNSGGRRTKARKPLLPTSLEHLEDRLLLAIGNPSWVEQGPSPRINSGTQGLTSQQNPTSGSINAVTFADANTALVATVNGGIWRTTNFTNLNPTWTPVSDQAASLAISAIAFSPGSNPSVAYAGTGSLSSNAGDGGPAKGVLKSIDGGVTWNSVGGTALNGSIVRTIVPTTLNDAGTAKQVVLVATDTGVWRSNDAGATFTQITSGLPAGAARNLVADPSDLKTFYATVLATDTTANGVYRTTNGGVDWQAVNTGITPLANAANLKLAAFPGGTGATPRVLYVGVILDDSSIKVYRSTNQGASWTAFMDTPFSTENSGVVGLNPGNQTDNYFYSRRSFRGRLVIPHETRSWSVGWRRLDPRHPQTTRHKSLTHKRLCYRKISAAVELAP